MTPVSYASSTLCLCAMSEKGLEALDHSDCCLVQRAGHQLSACQLQLSLPPSSTPVSASPPPTRDLCAPRGEHWGMGWGGDASNHPLRVACGPRPCNVAVTDPDHLPFGQCFKRYVTGHLQFANAVEGRGNPEVTDTDTTPVLMRILHTQEHRELFAVTSTEHGQTGDTLLSLCLCPVLHSLISQKGVCFVVRKKDTIFLKTKTTNKERTQSKKTTVSNSGW